jgi:hypothetical protein
MRFFPSYNKPSGKRRYLLGAAIGLFAALFVSSTVYSPAHIGRHVIPIPTLIPIIGHSPSPTAVTSQSAANQSASRAAAPGFNHLNITTTFFWVGEKASSDNGGIPNAASTWDGQWQQHYGGEDAPSPRNGFYPAAFTPKENPFYFALPYSDIDSRGNRKTTADKCPLAVLNTSYSWCKNSWLAIRHGGKIAYAQWEDAGPFGENDVNYVFGDSPPGNGRGSAAGLDVSPALRDYLGLQDVDKTDWAFVEAAAVPNGPWKAIITATAGDSVN